jgi:hypothetical protein
MSLSHTYTPPTHTYRGGTGQSRGQEAEVDHAGDRGGGGEAGGVSGLVSGDYVTTILLYVISYMLYVICRMSYVLCLMSFYPNMHTLFHIYVTVFLSLSPILSILCILYSM